MKIKTFIRASALTALGLGFGAMEVFGKSFVFGNNFKVNEQRIANRIAALSKFGRDANGHGFRVAYTKGDIDGRAWFKEQKKNRDLNQP